MPELKELKKFKKNNHKHEKNRVFFMKYKKRELYIKIILSNMIINRLYILKFKKEWFTESPQEQILNFFNPTFD